MSRRTFWVVVVVSACAAILLLGLGYSGDSPKRGQVEAQCNRAMVHAEKGEHDAANEDYTKAIELDPKCAKAYCNRADVHNRKGAHDKAICDCSKAIGLDPRMPETYANRAEAYFCKRLYDKAWADVKTCRKLGGKVDPAFLAELRKASGREE